MFLWLKEDKDLETVLPSAATAAETPSVFGLLGQMFRPGNRSVLYAFLGTFLFHSAHAAYQAGVSGFGVFEVNVSAGRVGQLVGVADIVYVLLAFPSGLLANRFGPRPVMMVGMLMYMVVCLSGALFITN
ncbi:MAG: hypothetical protein KDE51_05920, partial [Anaerolineales bacterium]|nr:hypothetical protein [Anaerolineales bacterium]